MPEYRSRNTTHGYHRVGARALRRATGMQQMLYPPCFLTSMGLGKAFVLLTDGQFSRGTSSLSMGHVSAEAAKGDVIGLVEAGGISQMKPAG